MAVFVTGDIHGSHTARKLGFRKWPRGRKLTREDYVVILGDFGVIWNAGGSDGEELWWLDWLEDRPWTTLVIEGNHENHDRINSGEFPVREWHGGRVHEFRPHVLHLMRGEVFDIGGMSFLAFGGANSNDRQWRTEGVDWWAAEAPSAEERVNCVANLAAHGNRVDVVLTHEAPAAAWEGVLAESGYEPDDIAQWLQENIADRVEFRRWYFGHHHIDKPDAAPFTPLYNEIVEVDLG